MYVVTLSVFHNLAIWLLYVNKPEPEPESALAVASGALINRQAIVIGWRLLNDFTIGVANNAYCMQTILSKLPSPVSRPSCMHGRLYDCPVTGPAGSRAKRRLMTRLFLLLLLPY